MQIRIFIVCVVVNKTIALICVERLVALFAQSKYGLVYVKLFKAFFCVVFVCLCCGMYADEGKRLGCCLR